MRTEIRNITLAAILAVTPAGLNQQDKSTGSEFNTYLPIIVNGFVENPAPIPTSAPPVEPTTAPIEEPTSVAP